MRCLPYNYNSYHSFESSDDTYASLILRRRFCKRVFILFCVFFASFYAAVCLFVDFKTHKVISFSGVNRCPACCGVSVCNILHQEFEYIVSNPVPGSSPDEYLFVDYIREEWRWRYLAQDAVFAKFDQQICTAWDLEPSCRWKDVFLNFDLNKALDKIVKLVDWKQSSETSLLTFCPEPKGVIEFLQTGMNLIDFSDKENQKHDLINLWTMLSVNPEPIILQTMSASNVYWPLPLFGGCCGRLSAVSYEGVPLSTLFDASWSRKVEIAAHILKAAIDFTFEHKRYRFYLLDWTPENIIVKKLNEVVIINLKRIVIFDSQTFLKNRFGDKSERSCYKNRSSDTLCKLCTNDVSDYNIRKACLLLAGGRKPFLADRKIKIYFYPSVRKLLEECQDGLLGKDLYKKATAILHHMKDIINQSINQDKR